MTDAPADDRALWFETGAARLILDPAGRLLRANPAATAMIEAGDLFVLRAGLLVCLRTQDRAAFAQLLADAAKAPRLFLLLDAAGRIILIRARSLEDTLVLEVRPVGPMTIDQIPDLSRLFGLTPTEALVARWLIVGLSEDAIAEELGLSVETLRTHRKRIYSKTNATTRSDFIANMTALFAY
jgi:DNA-binding CsgD family transcriptional regulator